ADDQLRFLKVPHLARPKAQSDFPIGPNDRWAGWRPATDDDAQNCTAVGYYFARRLRQVLRVPVGLVDISWGGTMAQHWASQKSLSRIPEMKPYFDDFQTKMAKWNEGGGEEGAKKRYEAELKTWEAAKAAAEAEGKRAPRRPRLQGNPGEQRQPSGMFHAMVLPLAKLSVRGVLFYQGENNSFGTSWKPFYASFPSVVRDWREVFESPKMPFGIIQIAGWSNRRTMTYDMNHHTNVVREIQFDTWRKTPGTGLIVTYDTNSNGSIHPASKRPIGERSARWALAEVYSIQGARSKKAIEWKGPVYESMRVDNGKIIVSFEEDGARGLRLNKDDARGFYIAGADRVFRHAKARVQGREVVVWSDDVKEPVAVRYAVSNLPNGTLLNGRELPAYPFRTDDWPIVPHQSTGEYRRK
ncbi:MAG: sialate O-acetylesterase, partial [Planctomycetota bacterium]